MSERRFCLISFFSRLLPVSHPRPRACLAVFDCGPVFFLLVAPLLASPVPLRLAGVLFFFLEKSFFVGVFLGRGGGGDF